MADPPAGEDDRGEDAGDARGDGTHDDSAHDDGTDRGLHLRLPDLSHVDTGAIRVISPRLQSLVGRPWPLHRARLARVLLVALFVIAPLVATVFTWWGVASQTERLAIDHSGDPGDRALWVDATPIDMDPDIGELAVRLVFTPRGDVADADRLAEELTLVVNDQGGRNVRTYEPGQVIEPFTAVLPLEGNSARYPFDTYDGALRIGAATGPAEDGTPLPVDLALSANLDDFATEAHLEVTENTATVDLDLSRRWAAITWVLFFMAISWAIALGCAGITWWVIVFNAECPFWAYPLFASVLFALPSLRAGLPGNPRYGVLVDWAAFYWAIAVVAMSLILVLVAYNVTARAEYRSALRAARDGTAPPQGPTTTPRGGRPG